MIQRKFGALIFALCLAAFIAGCGNKNSAPVSTGTVQPAPMTQAQRETNALPLAQMAPVPKSLHCSGAIVWANATRKTFHLSDDPYYGRTKHGEYMCQAAAVAQGYHAAGARHHRRAPRSMQELQQKMQQYTPQPQYT